ncbi:hypothetical protein DXF96_10590 [Heyndrickxia coagulans]|nr:hypothetical protein C3766_04900 [Heyndrickxia coagulans]AWP36386.1 hypothetical protein CYJ15_05035 [Heyndrickxia coagulans]QDI61891.1 hypothetical protein DXF96_10590 [Heyndrickxia coagulans]
MMIQYSYIFLLYALSVFLTRCQKSGFSFRRALKKCCFIKKDAKKRRDTMNGGVPPFLLGFFERIPVPRRIYSDWLCMLFLLFTADFLIVFSSPYFHIAIFPENRAPLAFP